MAEEQKQAPAPGGAPRREGGGGHGGHGGGRREGGPGGAGPGGPGGRPRGKRQYFRKKKVCKFCVEKMDFIDYKRADILSQFVQERGKILPRRMTGVCARHQRWLGVAIKRARNIALLPFAGSAGGSCRARACNTDTGSGDAGASGGDTSASCRSAEGVREQEHREKTCKLFFRKTLKSWATAATW